MSLFETTQMLEQLPVPRDDAHQQVVPGRSNPYNRPEFSKGFDYSKWDNIDTDDDEEEKPLSPAKREAPVTPKASSPGPVSKTARTTAPNAASGAQPALDGSAPPAAKRQRQLTLSVAEQHLPVGTRTRVGKHFSTASMATTWAGKSRQHYPTFTRSWSAGRPRSGDRG